MISGFGFHFRVLASSTVSKAATFLLRCIVVTYSEGGTGKNGGKMAQLMIAERYGPAVRCSSSGAL